MKSKVFVEYDFTKHEPYLQLVIDDSSIKKDERPDLRDTALKHFQEAANGSLMYLTYDETSQDNNLPQVRVLTPYNTSEELMQYVIANFELFAKQWFQDTEMEHVESFFSALRIKVSLKAPIK